MTDRYNWTVDIKIYNFNRLSSRNETTSINLTDYQMIGNETLVWTKLPQDVADNFYFGERLYFEVKFPDDLPSPLE